MKWIDISVPVAEDGMPLWPGSKPVRFEKQLSLQRGDHADDTVLSMGIHTGTHVDAPSHFVPGTSTIDQLDLEVFVGPCWVADCRRCAKVGAEELRVAGIPAGTDRVLLRTDNDQKWGPSFDPSFVGVSLDGAEWLVEQGVRLLGVNYLSVQPYGDTNEIHRTLLRSGVPVVEGLRLDQVEPGPYALMCLPMKLVGIEGAPARALLFPAGALPDEMMQ